MFHIYMIDSISKQILWKDSASFVNSDDAIRHADSIAKEFAIGAAILRKLGRAFTDPQQVKFIVDESD